MVWTRQQAFSIARLDCYSSRTRVKDDSSKSTKSGDQHINVPGPYLALNYHTTTAQNLGDIIIGIKSLYLELQDTWCLKKSIG
jgi:hypothetical protein